MCNLWVLVWLLTAGSRYTWGWIQNPRLSHRERCSTAKKRWGSLLSRVYQLFVPETEWLDWYQVHWALNQQAGSTYQWVRARTRGTHKAKEGSKLVLKEDSAARYRLWHVCWVRFSLMTQKADVARTCTTGTSTSGCKQKKMEHEVQNKWVMMRQRYTRACKEQPYGARTCMRPYRVKKPAEPGSAEQTRGWEYWAWNDRCSVRKANSRRAVDVRWSGTAATRRIHIFRDN